MLCACPPTQFSSSDLLWLYSRLLPPLLKRNRRKIRSTKRRKQPRPAKAPLLPRKSALRLTSKAGEFTTEAEAKASCPGDTVVWVNTGTKVYHHAGTATYGKTKRGVYMCEKDTAAAGFRAAKNEKKSS